MHFKVVLEEDEEVGGYIVSYPSVKSTSKCQIMKGIGHNSKIKLFQ